MGKTINEITVDELREIIRDVVSQTLRELLADPDAGLELQESLRESLQSSIAEVRAGAQTTPAEAVAAQLGLEW
jgi:hypothetical protein